MKPERRITGWPQGGIVSHSMDGAHTPPRRFHIGDRVMAGWVGQIGTVTKEQTIDGYRPHYRVYVKCDPGQEFEGLEGAEYNFQPWED